jgi:hypothetical protein
MSAAQSSRLRFAAGSIPPAERKQRRNTSAIVRKKYGQEQGQTGNKGEERTHFARMHDALTS